MHASYGMFSRGYWSADMIGYDTPRIGCYPYAASAVDPYALDKS